METAEESAATVERTPELSQTIFVLEDDQGHFPVGAA